jgi:hypothetical protein
MFGKKWSGGRKTGRSSFATHIMQVSVNGHRARCIAVTQIGSQCTRMSAPNASTCYQHYGVARPTRARHGVRVAREAPLCES